MKEKLILLYVGVFLLFLGCSRNAYITQPILLTEELPEICEGIIELLESDWIKHRSGYSHFDDKKLFEKLEKEYSECIQKLSRKQVIELFGEPNQTYSDEISYSLSEACRNNFQKQCYYFVFHFYPNKQRVAIFIREERIVFD